MGPDISCDQEHIPMVSSFSATQGYRCYMMSPHQAVSNQTWPLTGELRRSGTKSRCPCGDSRLKNYLSANSPLYWDIAADEMRPPTGHSLPPYPTEFYWGYENRGKFGLEFSHPAATADVWELATCLNDRAYMLRVAICMGETKIFGRTPEVRGVTAGDGCS